MKKFLVIGNPIEHSLSPKLHNFWIKSNNLKAVYDKKKLDLSELDNLIKEVREKKIDGINVTVPFKNSVIPFLDKLSNEAEKTQSVNTIYLKDEMVIGHNTDIEGFELAIKHTNYDVDGKNVLILGAGGVSPSLVVALNNMNAKKIFISNRTHSKAENLKKTFNDIEIIKWGTIPDFDMIINATSLGLKNDENIILDYSKISTEKFFYDVIYNPSETNFLRSAKKNGNKIENGKKMFVYQAQASFKIWNNLEPKIDDKIMELLN
jgi:shikimate dehydrogenase